jgi:SAM-dependent methyltransferase
MVRWWTVVSSRSELQNPTSAEKIRLLGEQLGLDGASRVLDIGSGRGGPATLLAREFGCRITSVELIPEFVAVARARAQEAGVADLIDVVESDAKDFRVEPAAYDAALCIGASFAFDGLVPTVQALVRAVPPRGLVAVGEPFWREWPLPDGFEPSEDEDFLTLPLTVERFESAGVEVISLIASSQDDWDRYEALLWLTLDEWLAANPDDPQAEEFRALGRSRRDRYLRWRRDLLDWAIFVCRVP